MVCGYGRFGKAVVRTLRKEGLTVMVVEAEPARIGCEDCVLGRGTEAHTLLDAGIQEAAGIVAGTDDDVNNLSIIMTARELNPKLFCVIRQNRQGNGPLFTSLGADVTMEPSHIVAHEFLSLLTTPLLSRFFAPARGRDNDWANELLSRIAALVGETVPEVWDVKLDPATSIACWEACQEGKVLRLGDLLREPADRVARLAMIPLLLKRQGQEILLPEESVVLAPEDRILFCGTPGTRHRLTLALRNQNVLDYLLTGRESPGGWIWQRLHGRWQT